MKLTTVYNLTLKWNSPVEASNSQFHFHIYLITLDLQISSSKQHQKIWLVHVCISTPKFSIEFLYLFISCSAALQMTAGHAQGSILWIDKQMKHTLQPLLNLRNAALHTFVLRFRKAALFHITTLAYTITIAYAINTYQKFCIRACTPKTSFTTLLLYGHRLLSHMRLIALIKIKTGFRVLLSSE